VTAEYERIGRRDADAPPVPMRTAAVEKEAQPK
jgi:hypothetical protein